MRVKRRTRQSNHKCCHNMDSWYQKISLRGRFWHRTKTRRRFYFTWYENKSWATKLHFKPQTLWEWAPSLRACFSKMYFKPRKVLWESFSKRLSSSQKIIHSQSNIQISRNSRNSLWASQTELFKGGVVVYPNVSSEKVQKSFTVGQKRKQLISRNTWSTESNPLPNKQTAQNICTEVSSVSQNPSKALLVFKITWGDILLPNLELWNYEKNELIFWQIKCRFKSFCSCLHLHTMIVMPERCESCDRGRKRMLAWKSTSTSKVNLLRPASGKRCACRSGGSQNGSSSHSRGSGCPRRAPLEERGLQTLTSRSTEDQSSGTARSGAFKVIKATIARSVRIHHIRVRSVISRFTGHFERKQTMSEIIGRRLRSLNEGVNSRCASNPRDAINNPQLTIWTVTQVTLRLGKAKRAPRSCFVWRNQDGLPRNQTGASLERRQTEDSLCRRPTGMSLHEDNWSYMRWKTYWGFNFRKT